MSGYHKDALPHSYELGEYVIEAVLGHGGFGITYLAHDSHLQTRVALKEYFPSELSIRVDIAAVAPKQTPKAQRDYQLGLKSFIKEARALAHFKHPHIVRVLRYLEANGTAYMVMEYEQGGSLADHLRLHGPRLDEAALFRIFMPILNGMHAIHDADMLHLDIKPENIYLRQDGSPMLIDFGSARQAISHTMPERFLVTHGYAPIEQYPDKGKQGPWTDIYALGASMYRCISGKRPINALERYQAILTYHADPLVPAAVAGKEHYSPPLLECIDWALQVYPRDRPQSVRKFQDRLLNRTGATTRTATATATVRTASTTSVARTGTSKPAQHRSAPSARMPRKRNRWWAPLLLVGALLAGGYLWLGQRTAGTPEPERSGLHPAVTGDKAASGESDAAKSGVPAAPTLGAAAMKPPVLYQTLAGHAGAVFALAFSTNGKRIATGGADGTVRVWDSLNGALLKTLKGHTRAVTSVAFSRDGRWLASASQDGTVRLWDARALTPYVEWRGLGGPLNALAFAPDGQRLAAAGRGRRIVVWDVANGTTLFTLGGHTDEILALAYSADGQWLASGGADKTARLWNAASGGEAVSLSVHRAEVHALAFSPDSRWLATGAEDYSVRLIETGGGMQVRTLTPASAPIQALAFAPDGRQLIIGTTDRHVLLVDTDSGALLRSLDGGAEAVTSVVISADGRLIAAGNHDGRARIWQLR